jgi:hypothetical protein
MFRLTRFCLYCTYTEAAALQTEYVRIYRATIADLGDDAGRAGTAPTTAAGAEGPEAGGRIPHPRGTSCARNTSLTSELELLYSTRHHLSPGIIPLSFLRRGYLARTIHTCSLLSLLLFLGTSHILIVAFLSLMI